MVVDDDHVSTQTTMQDDRCQQPIVLGVPVSPVTREQFLALIEDRLQETIEKPTLKLYTINPELLITAMKDEAYHSVLRDGDLNVIDGVGVAIALRMRGHHVPTRICGSDLIYDLCRYAASIKRPLLIIGGVEKIQEAACKRLEERFEGLRVFGVSPPFTEREDGALDEDSQKRIEKILAQHRPCVVAVCLGARKQEMWIANNYSLLKESGVRIASGLGGVVDFVAGAVPRAPQFMKRVGAEWLFRLLIQPKRLKRQLGTIPAFLWQILTNPSSVVCSQKETTIS